MGTHITNPQRKENEELPEKNLNEMEASIVSEKEFRIRLISFLHSLDENVSNIKIKIK